MPASQKEACPLNLAPTASTTAALALGDALAVALMDARGFSERRFRALASGRRARPAPAHARARRHAHRRCRSARCRHRDVLRRDARDVAQAHGHDGGARRDERVIGIFTDGDLRRTLEKASICARQSLASVMTREPRTISPDQLAAEAVESWSTTRSTRSWWSTRNQRWSARSTCTTCSSEGHLMHAARQCAAQPRRSQRD